MRCTGVGRTGLTAVGSNRIGLGIPDSRGLDGGGTAAIMRTGRGMPDGRYLGAGRTVGAAQICIGPIKTKFVSTCLNCDYRQLFSKQIKFPS